MCVCLWHVCIMPYVHSIFKFHIPCNIDLTCSLIFQLQLKLTLVENKEGDRCIFASEKWPVSV